MTLLFVATVALFVFSTFEKADSSAYDKIVAHSRIRARKEGPNVCALQQVMGTKKKYFSTCRNWYQKAICGKKTIVLYECCPGYMKLEGMRGCPAVAPIDHVFGTLGLVKATSTQGYADIAKIRPEIEGSGSFTFFAPSNEAWELLDKSVRSALVSNVNLELYNALHYHMVNKRLLTKDLKNGRTVTSMENDLGLLINHYSNGVVTVNCARIIHGNQVATNGVVHVIDRVISAIGGTIQDFIESADELTTLNDVAKSAGLLEELGQAGHYTLFAPTNEAFKNLGRDVLDRLRRDKEVLKALLNFHLLNSVQCSEAIMAGSSYETMEGNNIQVGCDGESLTVNGIKMVRKKDIVTTNGVIHLIDQVLMPDSAKQVMELLESSQSNFRDMVAQLGLSASMRPKADYTLLAPLNAAFTDEVMSMDLRLLRILLESHILKNKIVLEHLYNGQRLETIGGKFLRVFIYRTAVCIENSCLIRGSKEGSNGALHLMRNLLKPSEKTMYEILYENGGFKIFLTLMEAAGFTDLLKQEGDFTLFAPSDKAFAGLTEKELALLMGDINALRTILLYHISNGIFIGGGLETGVTNLLKSLQGSNVKVMFVNNTMQVNSIKVPESDIMATNGVIHYVNQILYPGDVPVGSQDFLMLLKKLITYMQIKYISGFRYQEIPLTFMKRIITSFQEVPDLTKVTRVTQGEPIVKTVIEGKPTMTKVIRVVEGDPSFTKVTKVIEGEPIISHVSRVIEGDPSFTTVTRVIEGKPIISHVSRVVEGEPIISHVSRVIEGDPSFTKVTRVVEGEPIINHVSRVIEGEPIISHVSRVIEGDPSFTKVTRIIEGEPIISHVSRVVEGDPSFTKVTRIIEGEPIISHVRRVVEGDPSFTTITRAVEEEPIIRHVSRVIEGDPSFTKVTRIVSGPQYSVSPGTTKVNLEDVDNSGISKIEGKPQFASERLTKMIQGGSRRTTHRRVLAGNRRRGRN